MNSTIARKIAGCWLGKTIGGTLGANTEGLPAPAKLSFYSPIPTEPVPNDDLELQVFLAAALEQMDRPVIDRDVLAGLWLKHNRYPFDEYGVALRNLSEGIRPPVSGKLGNFFTDGLGAAIRSELWAVLAPGAPALAAQYAFEDACVDHDGNGTAAEMFLSAMQSEAFSESDPKILLTHALSVIPPDLRLRSALEETIRWCGETSDPDTVRTRIMERYANPNMTDVVMNLPFMAMALLLGKGDFEKSILLAVNCGYDTDCTGATVGATLGIIDPDRIPLKWSEPVGDQIAFSGYIRDLEMPNTLAGLTQTVLRLREKLGDFRKPAESSALPPRKIVFGRSLIRWEDFRLDNFRSVPAAPLETTGYSGVLDLPDPFSEGIVSLTLKFRIREKKERRLVFNMESWMRCFLDGKLLFSRESGELMPAAHRTAVNQFADKLLDPGVHTLSVQTFRTKESVKKAAFYFGIADVATKLWETIEPVP